jgi:pimeloyl-ACP methyl ester carboxylesterase
MFPGARVLLLVLLLALPRPAAAQAVSATGEFIGSIDIGGRKIHLECRGAGAPTVILISGYRNDGEIWTVEPGAGLMPVFTGVAAFAQVCAYDRPGTVLDTTHVSRSDPVPMPRTADEVIAELHALLAVAKIPGPYVLVAHSLGGLFARLYASTWPDEVAGMVLVDALPESLEALLGPPAWKAFESIASGPIPGLEKYSELEHIDFTAASNRMAEMAAKIPLRPMPLFVISRGKPVALPPNLPAGFSPQGLETAWRAGQERLAALLPDARHEIAAESDHYVQIAQPALVVDAVRRVVDAVRDRASWRPSRTK